MPFSVDAPDHRISIEPLSQDSFAQFGTVIENPEFSGLRKDAISANQGSAVKYVDISELANFYYLAPSRKPSKPTMNMYVCRPRQLRTVQQPSRGIYDQQQHDQQQRVLEVKVLERHPFTSQTFIPLGLPANDASVQYLVIVAPTLPTSSYRSKDDVNDDAGSRPRPYPVPDRKPKRSIFDMFSRARPSPFTNERAPPSPTPRGEAGTASSSHSVWGAGSGFRRPKGAGRPDLMKARAFLANGSQAVTYGAGTWHAPMVVLGQRPVDFVVVQFANGVDLEDCQEVELRSESDSEGLAVTINANVVAVGSGYDSPKAKL